MNRKMGFYRWAALTGSLLLVLLAGLLSPAAREGRSATETYTDTGTGADIAIETDRPETDVSKAEAGEEAAKDFRRAEENGSPQTALTEAQRLLLDELLSLMERGELGRAATVMNEKEEELEELLLVTFGGHRRLYSDKGIMKEPEGRGLVLKSPSVLFYGNFADGVPEGRVTALQEIVLEAPRYDYSIGTWSGGRMNGDGITGYFYYEGTGKMDGMKTERAGRFIEDHLDGMFRYTSIDRDGDSTTFLIRAKDGVTHLDERWSYEEEKGEYCLPAQGEETHLYLLKESSAKEVLWKNRILWE